MQYVFLQFQIQKMRQMTNFESYQDSNNESPKEQLSTKANRDLFIVVDTNVFLANLSSIKSLLDIKGKFLQFGLFKVC